MYKNWKLLKSKFNGDFELTEKEKATIAGYDKDINEASEDEKKSKEDIKLQYMRKLHQDFEKAKEETQKEYSEVAKWCNENGQYHIEDQGEYYAVVENLEPTEEQIKQKRIAELKQKLAETDYVVIKIAEGEATEEEYAEVLAQRKAWRAEINELQA